MPLDLVIDKLEAVAEPLRNLYQEKDGKFHLDVSGVPDVTGLKSALEREKVEAKKYKDDNAAYRGLGKSADEIKALIDKADADAAEAAKKAGNFDQILDGHKKKWDGEKAALETKNAATLDLAKKSIVDAGLSTALAKAKATPSGITLLMRILPAQVKLDFADGSPQTEILDGAGKPLIGTGADGRATYDDLVKAAIKDYPELFEGTGAGGGGATQRGSRGAGNKQILRAEFEKLDPGSRAARMRDGFTVVDS